MAHDEWIQDTPRLVPANYKALYSTPCELMPDGFEWYKGTGIVAAKHPLEGWILFSTDCGACESEDTLIIAAQWSVNYHNGDRYWDYELACQSCGKFTQRSFAEND
jgi:hypothetical protein